jgi:hypothetical protein
MMISGMREEEEESKEAKSPSTSKNVKVVFTKLHLDVMFQESALSLSAAVCLNGKRKGNAYLMWSLIHV